MSQDRDYGYTQGELIYWSDSESQRRGYGGYRPVKAVYICRRGSKAGIACLRTDGAWVPKVVSYTKIGTRWEK